jgi:phosphorylcholine metabolism protein LicD
MIQEQYYIKKDLLAKLYALMAYTHILLKQHKIDYWIDGGTILGAVRNKGIIPWDDDVDITVMNSQTNLQKLNSNKFKEQLTKKGFSITRTYFGYKIFYTNGKQIKTNPWRSHKRKFKEKNPHITKRADVAMYASKTYKKTKKVASYESYKYPFLDIFLAKKKEDKIIYIKNRWPKCSYKKTDLYPLKLYKLGKLQVYGPNNPEPYFKGCYGGKWDSVGIINYDHANEKKIGPYEFKL